MRPTILNILLLATLVLSALIGCSGEETDEKVITIVSDAAVGDVTDLPPSPLCELTEEELSLYVEETIGCSYCIVIRCEEGNRHGCSALCGTENGQ